MKTNPVFRMFYDVDAKFETSDDLPDVMTAARLFRSLQEDTRRFYPDADDDLLRLVVCVAPDKELQQGGVVKRGWHVHFPNLLVTREQALLLHASAASALGRLPVAAQFRFQRDQAWDTVLDPSVFFTNGLRAVGNDKTSRCGVCKGRRPTMQACDACHGRGRVAENRVYQMGYTIGGDGNPDNAFTQAMKRDTLALLRATSIRAPEGAVADPRFRRYEGSPSPYAMEERINPRTQVATLTTREEDPGAVAALGPMVKQRISDYTLLASIQNVVRSKMPSVYQHVEVRAANWKDRGKREIFVQLKGEGSNFCFNVNRDHNANTAWFYITRDGISQRCFSAKCRGYHGPVYPISHQDYQDLFPAVTKSQKQNRASMCCLSEANMREQAEVDLSRYLATYERRLFAASSEAPPVNPVQAAARSSTKRVKRYDTRG